MTPVLSGLIGQVCNDKPIIIIIDRLDQCAQGSESGDDIDALNAAIWSLVHVMCAQPESYPKVKILLDMDERPARNIPKMFRWTVNNKLLGCRVNWNQQVDAD
jgi:hypothetical protein